MNLGGQEYSEDQIAQWLQGKSQAEIAQQAAQMGLNAGEIQSALSAGGQNYTANDINGAASSLGYNFDGSGGDLQKAPATQAPGGMTIAGQYYDPMTDPTRAGQGYGTSGRDIWSPAQGRWIDPAEVGQFMGTNPTQQQILKTASELGLTLQDINTAIKGQGGSFVDQSSQYNSLASNAFNGGLGYSAEKSANGFFDDGRIVAGGGHSQPGGESTPWVRGTPSSFVIGNSPDYTSSNTEFGGGTLPGFNPAAAAAQSPARPVGALTLVEKQNRLRKATASTNRAHPYAIRPGPRAIN